MNSDYDAIIIGSGLGGLTAGALLAKSGRKVLLLERHLQFGGSATYFKRKGMRIEVGLHEIDGFDELDPKTQIFNKLGLRNRIELIKPKSLYALKYHNLNHDFIMPDGYDAAQKAVINEFPEHKSAIITYFKTLDKIRRCLVKFITAKRSSLWWLINGPIFPFRFFQLLKYEKTTLGEFLQKLFGDNEKIKIVLAANFGYYTEDIDKLSILFFSAAQSSYHKGGSYYIKGGSQMLSDELVKIIEENGGEALHRREVTKILIENDAAIGVEHEKSELIAKPSKIKNKNIKPAYAPLIIGNAAPSIIAKMLPEYMGREFEKKYKNFNNSTSLWSIFIGFKEKPENYGVTNYSSFIFPKWVNSFKEIASSANLLKFPPTKDIPGYVFVDYSQIDANLTDEGYHLGIMCGIDNIDNWQGFTKQEYQAHKKLWCKAFINSLDEHFPGIKDAIIYKEMATAKTVNKYLNTPDGAVYGFSQEPNQSGRFRPQSKTIIKGLHLASAFVAPGGGFTGAIMAGDNAVREIIKDEYYKL